MYKGYAIIHQTIPINTHNPTTGITRLISDGICYVTYEVNARGSTNYVITPDGKDMYWGFYYTQKDLQHLWKLGAIEPITDEVAKDALEEGQFRRSEFLREGGTSISLSS